MELYQAERVIALYERIGRENRAKLLQGGVGDPFLRAPASDSRMSLALLLRVEAKTAAQITAQLERLRAVEPALYYYPPADFHVTVLDILRGVPGRTLPARLEEYRQCIAACAAQCAPFSMTFCGLTASDNAVLVKGYYECGLEKLRRLLRQQLKRRGLPLEERYETFSGHITVARIPERLENPRAFLAQVERAGTFGTTRVCSLELVFHNWYDSQKTVLARFALGEEAVALPGANLCKNCNKNLQK